MQLCCNNYFHFIFLHSLKSLLMLLKTLLSSFCILVSILSVSVIFAQDKNLKDSLKEIKLTEIIIQETVRQQLGQSTLNANTLTGSQASSLGAALNRMPGVQQTAYGASSSAPMIRSLSGNRVKILQNGLSFHELSGISPNFSIAVDLGNMASIDLYKGSSTVLYGGQAIGGAVNLREQSIPASLFPEKVQLTVGAEMNNQSGHRQTLSVSGNMGKRWAWNLGGFNQQQALVRIPGDSKPAFVYQSDIDAMTEVAAQVHVDAHWVLDKSLFPYLSQLAMERLDDPKWGLTADDVYTFDRYYMLAGKAYENPVNKEYIAGQDGNLPLSHRVVYGIHDYVPVEKGKMPNSHASSRAIHAGFSYFLKPFRLGFGYQANEGYYGIPGVAMLKKLEHSHNHNGSMPALHYDPINSQALAHRLQAEASYVREDKLLKEVLIRYAYHYGDDRELLGIYRVNKFNSHHQALRTEINLQPLAFWQVKFGWDETALNLLSDGEKRYLPSAHSRETGIFSMQHLQWKNLSLDLGYRHDWLARKVLKADSYQPGRGLAGGNLSKRNFNLQQFSSEISYTCFEKAYIKGKYSHAERAPALNELYAGNDHFALMIEENGNDKLNQERLRAYELALGAAIGQLSLASNVYLNKYQDYLYLGHTGMARSGGFPIKEWRAAATTLKGIEAEIVYQSTWLKQQAWHVSGFMDLVKNINSDSNAMRRWSDGDYMPNLPSSRYGFSAQAAYHKLLLQISVDKYLKQKYLGKQINPEPAMPAYTLVAAKLEMQFTWKGYKLLSYVSGNNLLNVEARPQQSLMKYLTPLAGRCIALGMRCNFCIIN